MKSLELNQSTIKAILGGATKVVIGIDEKDLNWDNEDVFIENCCPIQPSQEYYVVEEFIYDEDINSIYYRSNFDKKEWIELYNENINQRYCKRADQMQQHQSRIPKIVFENIEVKSVCDLSLNEKYELIKNTEHIEQGFWNERDFKRYLNEQNITSEYIFIADIKEVEIR